MIKWYNFCIFRHTNKHIEMQLNRIKEVLKEIGLSQVYLKDGLEARISAESVSRSYVSKLCNNKQQPSLVRLFLIAEILNVPAYTLIADYNPTKHNQEEEE